MLSNLVDGDARSALNALQMSVQAKLGQVSNTNHNHESSSSNSTSKHNNQTTFQRKPTGKSASDIVDVNDKGDGRSETLRIITADDIKEGLQRSHVLYDKTGLLLHVYQLSFIQR